MKNEFSPFTPINTDQEFRKNNTGSATPPPSSKSLKAILTANPNIHIHTSRVSPDSTGKKVLLLAVEDRHIVDITYQVSVFLELRTTKNQEYILIRGGDRGGDVVDLLAIRLGIEINV